MKKLLLMAGLLATTSAAFAQGTLVFANLAGGVNAPITNSAGGRIIGGAAGPNFVADLFFSTTLTSSSDQLTAAGFNQAFSTTTAGGGGYFLGGTKTLTGTTGAIEAQVRVWDLSKGATYAAALANNGEVGHSGLFTFSLTIPPSAPAPMVGLTGFHTVIPEPSTFALAGLGAAALVIFRRRK